MRLKSKKKWVKRLVVIMAACALLVYSSRNSQTVERAVSYIVYPFLIIQQKYIGSVKAWFTTRTNVAELHDTITQLQQEKESLLTTIIRLQAGKTYMDDIQELVAFKKRYSAPGVLAQVIMRTISDQSHFFIIDAGADKGIKADMVVVYKDHVVGRIVAVYPWYSKVILITDRACKVSAYCVTTKAGGILVGMNNKNDMQLTRVSHLCPVLEDDLIVTSGDGLVFPRGFALAKVRVSHMDGLFYTVIAEPLIDIHALHYCYVLHKGIELLQSS